MKLYATTTSERASKGQGGNEYIDIMVTNEVEDIILLVSVYPDSTCRITHIDDLNVDTDRISFIGRHNLYKKGEKKKGDSCKYCGITHTKYELCPLDIPR